MSAYLDGVQSPSSSKKLVDMQKQLGIRMRAKRAAMLAENTINIPMKDDDDIFEEENDIEDDSMDTTDESNDATSDVVSTMEKDNVKRQQQNERETSMSHFLSLSRRTCKSMKRHDISSVSVHRCWETGVRLRFDFQVMEKRRRKNKTTMTK